MSVNKHGLSRDIPAAIKRQVRQRDGFGCVVCGNAIVEYEHFDPEFAEAAVHDADGILLLCVGCHGRKTRGHLSRDTIDRHRKNQASRKLGYAHDAFDVGPTFPAIVMGNLRATNTNCLIRINGEDVLRVDPPEEPGSPYRLTAVLRNRAGQPDLVVVENEWRSPITNWDVTVQGKRITVKSGIRSIELILRNELPQTLVVERLDFYHHGFRIQCSEGQPTEMTFPTGNVMRSHGMSFDGAGTAIEIGPEGAAFGVGGSMFMEKVEINPEAAPESKQSADVIEFRRRET
jgi:hypothetical protein